ncbi:MAG: kelch repeat-containing protein [Phycisphaerales bacterium]
MLRPALLAALAVAPASVAQTCFWTNANVSGPPARSGHAMAYDSARGVVVLFGGLSGTSLGDTWEWNGTAWSLRATTGPSPRREHTMAYDSTRGQIVLFGGLANAVRLGDTWLWDGTSWRAASGGPPPRESAAMADDAVRQRVVLHGGFGGTPPSQSLLSDT